MQCVAPEKLTYRNRDNQGRRETSQLIEASSTLEATRAVTSECRCGYTGQPATCCRSPTAVESDLERDLEPQFQLAMHLACNHEQSQHFSGKFATTTHEETYKRQDVTYGGLALVSINEVALPRTRLLRRWVTACGRVSHLSM